MKFKLNILKEFLHVLFCEGWTSGTKKDNYPQQVIVSNSISQNDEIDVPSPDLSPVTSLSEGNMTSKPEKSQVLPQAEDVELPIEGDETVQIDISKSSDEVETCSATSLLDNKAYVKLASKLADLYVEMEMLDKNSSSEEVHDVLEIVENRVKEGLIATGAEPITGDELFNISRHETVPKSIVGKDTPILETLSPGVALGEKTLIKAKIKIK